MPETPRKLLPDIWTPEPFAPRRGLRGGHAQTLASYFFPRRLQLPPFEKRLFTVADGVQILALCHWHEPRRSALTLVIVHGLEGSCESQYVLGTTAKAWAAGMTVVRMNVRNCGGTHLLGPTLYHSGLSGDVGAVARELIDRDRLDRLALLGFSMGGNQVLKLAGEWGAHAPAEVRAVAAVSPAMDLGPSADALHERQNRLYEWNFLVSLQRSVRRKQRAFPNLFKAFHRRPFASLRQFDDQVTARYCGFAGADDYYTRASSALVAERIALPTLVIHSTDDPFIRMLPATREKLLANPWVRLVETAHGGHCAFLAAPNGYDGRWAERMVVEWVEQV